MQRTLWGSCRKRCVHGNDREYLPERILNCFATFFNTKQGKYKPSEFNDTTISNNEVLTDVTGINVFSQLLMLQAFIINRHDDLIFEPEEFDKQTEEVKQLIYDQCSNCILGCNMMLRLNQQHSKMNTKVHKSMLSKQGDAFVVITMEAVDQMVGFERMKQQSGRSSKKKSDDTLLALVLMGISDSSDTTPPDDTSTGMPIFRCYHCGKLRHSQHKCLLLSEK